MTINSLQLNDSTPVSGLGTQTFNVPTTGRYTFAFKSTIPYLPAGSATPTTAQSKASVNVTCAADTAGNKNSTFWTFNSAGDLYGYYVWYNINAAGVDPAPTGRTGIEVAGATGATAATLATATIAAIVASTAASYVTATAGASGHVVLTNIQYGLCTAAANGSASYGASYATTAGSYGDPETSGLGVVLKNNSTVLARYGFPSPSQPSMGGRVVVQATAGDVLTIVLSSLSGADNALNAVKTVVNLFAGE